ncbi:2-phospho-L-lactate guanylyltransferase [Myceligenerans sp. I2]|uniref:Phosphoenolpyruvate guanylyltransferase n=1 Tax=Myceligenerans indicum TaxID=2593663 RepID=A0ABS1LPG9_9MICO|nr:2-phospho-L-lactate guanylyltransferase [Myceligenerans indicum]
MTAVVPLRDGVSGKSRLATVLDDDARRALITALAQHVTGTLLATPQVDRVVVVTADAGFARSALGELSDVGDLTFLAQSPERPGLNAALDAAREYCGAGEPEHGGADEATRSLLVAHADLPALTPADLTDLVARAADVVVATDRAGRGTNLLLLRGGAAPGFRFRFGPDSRGAHEAEAARLGVRAVTVRRPGTAVDLDTVDDWNELPAEVRAAVGRFARFPSA